MFRLPVVAVARDVAVSLPCTDLRPHARLVCVEGLQVVHVQEGVEEVQPAVQIDVGGDDVVAVQLNLGGQELLQAVLETAADIRPRFGLR